MLSDSSRNVLSDISRIMLLDPLYTVHESIHFVNYISKHVKNIGENMLSIKLENMCKYRRLFVIYSKHFD
jgi:hypothetical protein